MQGPPSFSDETFAPSEAQFIPTNIGTIIPTNIGTIIPNNIGFGNIHNDNSNTCSNHKNNVDYHNAHNNNSINPTNNTNTIFQANMLQHEDGFNNNYMNSNPLGGGNSISFATSADIFREGFRPMLNPNIPNTQQFLDISLQQQQQHQQQLQASNFMSNNFCSMGDLKQSLPQEMGIHRQNQTTCNNFGDSSDVNEDPDSPTYRLTCDQELFPKSKNHLWPPYTKQSTGSATEEAQQSTPCISEENNVNVEHPLRMLSAAASFSSGANIAHTSRSSTTSCHPPTAAAGVDMDASSRRAKTEALLKLGGLVQARPGKFVRLVGTATTEKAITHGRAKIVDCSVCEQRYFVRRRATVLYCKDCQHFTPLSSELAGSAKSTTPITRSL